jgi:flagellar hook assembly protein FlgD
MHRKVLFAVLLGLIVVPPANARPTQLMPGVMYERILSWTPAGPLAMYVVTGPKPGGLYSFTPLLAKGTILGRETVSSMERRASTQMTSIGVVGDFSSWTGGWPSGLLIRGGVVEHQPVRGRASLGVDTNGDLHLDRVPWYGRWRGPDLPWRPIAWMNSPARANSATLYTPVWGGKTPAVRGVAAVLDPFPPANARRDLTATVTSLLTNSSVEIPPQGAVLVGRGVAEQRLREEAPLGSTITVRIPLPEDWSAVTDAISGGPSLVRDGRPIFNAGEALTRAQLRGRNPRTAIGQRADGGMVMVAVDGRQPRWSIGITNWQLALTMVRYGCVTALALDSGGSTTLAFDGKVLNRPSDRSGERPVGEALVIAYTGVYTPPVAPTLSPNGDGADDRATLSYKLVRPATVSAKLIAPDGSARELDAGQKAAGRHKLSWDGTDPAGTPAPEGRYRWSVSATDDLGRASTDERAFMLDNTLGFVHVAPNARRVVFTLTRDASVRVTVESRFGAILRTITAGPRRPGEVTAAWNGRDGRGKRIRTGSYVVRVAATSPLGLSQLRVPVRISR